MTEPAPLGPSRLKVALAMLAVYLIWGSTYLGIRIVVETIPPFLSAGLRFVLAGAMLFLFARLRGARSPTRADWKPAAITGGFLLLGGNGLVSFAEQTVASGIAALIIAIVPLFVVLLEWVGPGHPRPNLGVALGIALGLVGVAVLVDPTAVGASHIDPAGVAILLLASFLWSIGTLYGSRAKLPEPPLMAIGMEMLAGGSILLIAAAVLGEFGRLNIAAISQASTIAFVYLVLVGALVGFTSYLWLIRNVTPALATTYAFVNPVVAVYLGFVVLAEPITARTVVAAAIIIVGVAIITQARARGRPAPTREGAEPADSSPSLGPSR